MRQYASDTLAISMGGCASKKDLCWWFGTAQKFVFLGTGRRFVFGGPACPEVTDAGICVRSGDAKEEGGCDAMNVTQLITMQIRERNAFTTTVQNQNR